MDQDINNWTGKEWIALYTQPRAEKQAARNLQREGYECYLPLVKERHQWRDRMKWVEVPLIASYVFVRIEARELTLVRRIDCVVAAITKGHTKEVAIIPDRQMKDFMFMVEYAQEVRIYDAGKFCKGADVEVIAGDFKGKVGKLVTIEGEHVFGIVLQGVSFTIATIIDEDYLKVIQPETRKKKSIPKKTTQK